MNILDVKSLEELKTLGKHKDIAVQLKELAGAEIKIKTKSWQDLYESICNNRKQWKDKTKKANDSIPCIYFISKEAEIIFYLLELDGEAKLKKLGITKSCYTNKSRATKWRNELAKIIYPDLCHHPKADEAMSKMESMYEEMIGNAKQSNRTL